MTDNEPQHPEVDDLGLTSVDWEDLRIAYIYGLYEPAPGTVEEEAFRRMDYARSEVERSPPSRRPTKPGGRPGPAAHRRPSRNARPGNDHHRGRPRPQ